MTSRGIRALRRRLKLTQAQFATLLGVSGQSVLPVGEQGRRLKFRGATEAAIRDIVDIDASEAKALLGGTSGRGGTRKKRAKRGRRARR